MSAKEQSQVPLRVFISSTYEDMQPFREAVRDALTNIEQLPVGMEHFVSSPERSLDVCLTDVRRCQLYIVLVGMRYGSIDIETGKSYTELEYEEAMKNKIPVLAFVINENECSILPKYVDVGENAEKLKQLKIRLDENHMVSRFTSAENLKELVVRAVTNQLATSAAEMEQVEATVTNTEAEYVIGANLYKRFLLLPERYKGVETVLRVRMDSGFSTWRRRKEYFTAFGVTHGDTIIGNDLVALGVNMDDIDSEDISIDFYAEGKNADWILDNEIRPGTIFEGRFKFVYEVVAGGLKSRDMKIAALILQEGIAVVGKDNTDGAKKEKSDRRNRDVE